MPLIENILTFLAHIVTGVITKTGYIGIALGMALESACIPIPSELILPFGGFLVFQGSLSFWGVVMAGTVGGTIGSIGAYLVGYYGGRSLLLRYGRYVFLSPKHLEEAEKWFQRYGEATTFFTRLMPVIRTFISLPAGMARMSFLPFVFYTFLGSLPWSLLLTYIGMKLGENWQHIEAIFKRLDIVILVVIAVMLLYVFWRRRYDN